MSKPELRSQLRARRRALDAELRSAASLAAAARLLEIPELRRAATVALYAARPEEASPGAAAEALEALGARIVLPRVDGVELDFVATSGVDALRPGHRGVLEPDGDGIEAGSIDAIVVPGLGFGRDGSRLGSGGGHYDRALASLRPDALRIGFCFACQLLDSLPEGPLDQRVDIVVTEHEVVRVRPARNELPPTL